MIKTKPNPLRRRRELIANAFCPTGKGVVANAVKRKSRSKPNPLRSDPTRTATLRRKFLVAIRQRFNNIKRAVQELVVEEDAFGLKDSSPFTINKRWKFYTSNLQVQFFQQWLFEQFGRELLEFSPGNPTDDAYWQKYVEEGYRKGAGRAFDDATRVKRIVGGKEKLDFYNGTREQFLRSAFGRPESINKVKLLAGRTFTELEGVTQAMATRLSRALTDGLVQGQNPLTIAKTLVDDLGFGERQAETIARTEIIRAHAEGALDSFEEMGVEEIGVMVEWDTAKDGRVCPKCSPLQGVVMTVQEARGLFPRHPNAVFEGSTFISYGECEELVRAKYRGPSVVLIADNFRSTIGPNHPVLTTRGMLKAAQLCKGDKVLYDNWHNLSADVWNISYENFKEIPTVEDVFQSSFAVAANTGITLSTSDLHGDRVFCYGEVQAINPAGSLLVEFESLGIEQLRKDNFVRTNPKSQLVASNGSSPFGSERVLLSSPSSMSSPHSWIGADNRFSWVTLRHVENSVFEGWAFDATTASSLYCNNGLVVSNCRCSPIPANLGEDPTGQIRGKSKVEGAIAKSISAERPKGKALSIEALKKRTKWTGADKKIKKKRPKSLV